MSEEELMIQEKIKKREKTDIMIAYAMIVILLACILFVVYLKFIRKDNSTSNNDNNQTEYTINYIKLDDVINGLNSNLRDKYNGITSTLGDNSINISYGDLLYEVKLINNELEFKLDSDNEELSEDIYKEMIAIVCTFYSSDRTGCVNASKEVDNDTNGVRFVDNNVYINITSGITPLETVRKIVYADETIMNVDNTDYEINMNDKVVSDIKVVMSDTKVTVGGDISSNGKVTVKLYDDNNNELSSKEVDCESNFSIDFEFDDKLNKDNIKKYSISME